MQVSRQPLTHGVTATRRRRAAHTPAAINDPATTMPITVAAPNPRSSLPSSPRSTVPSAGAVLESVETFDDVVTPSATASSATIEPARSVDDVVVDPPTEEATIDDAVVVDVAAGPATGALVADVAVATGAFETTWVAGGADGAGDGAAGDAGAGIVGAVDGAAVGGVVVGGGELDDGVPQSEPLRELGSSPSIGGGGG